MVLFPNGPHLKPYSRTNLNVERSWNVFLPACTRKIERTHKDLLSLSRSDQPSLKLGLVAPLNTIIRSSIGRKRTVHTYSDAIRIFILWIIIIQGNSRFRYHAKYGENDFEWCQERWSGGRRVARLVIRCYLQVSTLRLLGKAYLVQPNFALTQPLAPRVPTDAKKPKYHIPKARILQPNELERRMFRKNKIKTTDGYAWVGVSVFFETVAANINGPREGI